MNWWLHDIEIWNLRVRTCLSHWHERFPPTQGWQRPCQRPPHAVVPKHRRYGKLCIQELLRLVKTVPGPKLWQAGCAWLPSCIPKWSWCIKTKIQMYQGQHGLNMLLTSLEGSLKGSPWICAGLSQIHVHQVSSAFCKGILKLETYSSSVLLCFTFPRWCQCTTHN